MSEMVERVAKAIALDECQTWSELDAIHRGMFYSFARAAIAAMREAPEKIVRAGIEADNRRTGYQTVLHIWRAMIDAALAS